MKANQRRAAQQPSRFFGAVAGLWCILLLGVLGCAGSDATAIDDEGGGSSSSSSSSSSSVAGDAAAARLGVAVLAQPPLRGCPRAMDVVWRCSTSSDDDYSGTSNGASGCAYR
jgi:hypothetical protein